VPIPNIVDIHIPTCFGLVSGADHMPIRALASGRSTWAGQV
jgi:hypothetical protein